MLYPIRYGSINNKYARFTILGVLQVKLLTTCPTTAITPGPQLWQPRPKFSRRLKLITFLGMGWFRPSAVRLGQKWTGGQDFSFFVILSIAKDLIRFACRLYKILRIRSG